MIVAIYSRDDAEPGLTEEDRANLASGCRATFGSEPVDATGDDMYQAKLHDVLARATKDRIRGIVVRNGSHLAPRTVEEYARTLNTILDAGLSFYCIEEGFLMVRKDRAEDQRVFSTVMSMAKLSKVGRAHYLAEGHRRNPGGRPPPCRVCGCSRGKHLDNGPCTIHPKCQGYTGRRPAAG